MADRNQYQPLLGDELPRPLKDHPQHGLERIQVVNVLVRIALDPIFPPPMNFSSTYKYNIPENALHYNKFELIYD